MGLSKPRSSNTAAVYASRNQIIPNYTFMPMFPAQEPENSAFVNQDTLRIFAIRWAEEMAQLRTLTALAAPTWWLATALKSSSSGLDTHFCLLQALQDMGALHICRQNTHPYEINEWICAIRKVDSQVLAIDVNSNHDKGGTAFEVFGPQINSYTQSQTYSGFLFVLLFCFKQYFDFVSVFEELSFKTQGGGS